MKAARREPLAVKGQGIQPHELEYFGVGDVGQVTIEGTPDGRSDIERAAIVEVRVHVAADFAIADHVVVALDRVAVMGCGTRRYRRAARRRGVGATARVSAPESG
jgi:hypothetical protein